MCGIAGFKSKLSLDNSIIKSMNGSLLNRGPDSEGYYFDADFTGGMRRLKINDLVNGDQPLFNRDKSVVLFYNGEIYNYKYLRNLLENKGYKFKTNSDGEVICHLYDEYSEDLFSMLDGMFAISLWLKKEKKLILARDIAGEKPLYYFKPSNNEIVYASTIKALSFHPSFKRDLNLDAIWDLPTFTWTPQPNTIFSNVKSFPHSHYMIIGDNGTHLKKYNFKYMDDLKFSSEKELIAYTKQLVEKSVNDRLLSDVPVGSFLSGGLDSSIVTYLASKSIKKLNTYTIGFENTEDIQHGESDESNYAEEFAEYLGTSHKTIKVTASNFLSDLKSFVCSMDQPFSIPSGLGIKAISQQAKLDGIKVLLSGDCADECFGGYSWYPYLNSECLDKSESISLNLSFHDYSVDNKEKIRTINSYPSYRQAWAWHYYASEIEKKNIFNKEFCESRLSSLRYFKEFNGDEHWKREEYIAQDRDFYLRNEMLQKLDRMTMANSIEGRVPFASPKILFLSSQLKYNHFYRNGQIKWLLKEAFADVIPREIINRPKHGFNVPLDHWFRNDWSNLLLSCFSKDSNLFKLGIIHDKSKEIIVKMLQNKMKLNGPIFFSFLVLELWLEEYKDYI